MRGLAYVPHLVRRLIRWTGICRSQSLFPDDFRSSAYWEQRYAEGGTSGAGSYHALARYKADVINQFVAKHDIRTVIDLGAGDGNQLSLLEVPRYLGLDISPTIVSRLRQRYSGDQSKEFQIYQPGVVRHEHLSATLALSLDVIYHLVEQAMYEEYMRDLFSAGERYVIIYSSDSDAGRTADHIYHRPFSKYVTANFPDWTLQLALDNPHRTRTFASFFIYARNMGPQD